MSGMTGEPLSFARLMEIDETRPSYPRSLVEMAYEQLLSMLVTMKIKPGAHIGIEALARQLNISQTPIREALTLLEAQKLAYKIPNVGFRAAELLSLDDINALFELRMLLEPKMAALAADRASASMLHELVLLSDSMARAAQGNDVAYAQFAEGDARLHHLIASASGNRFIAETIEGLHVHLHIFRFLVNTDATHEALAEHTELINALLKRDPAAAETAMREHLHASRSRMEAAGAGRIDASVVSPGDDETARSGKRRGRSRKGSGAKRSG